MYGSATVKLENGKLVLRYGPSFEGDLEHWQYDTFRAVWRNPRLGKSFVTFALDARARVSDMDVEGLADFGAVRDTTARSESSGGAAGSGSLPQAAPSPGTSNESTPSISRKK
jgi:hypothetical protein